jgi:tRNA threonylcarbamoyladenosine biosynthesis protein TsaE
MDFDLADSSSTERWVRRWRGRLPGVACGAGRLYLQGELGAGKTTCVRSLLRALGVTGLVRSPTYTLVETYVLPTLTCVHVDLYRLQSLTEVDELGLRDWWGRAACYWSNGRSGAGPQCLPRI